MGLDRRLSKPRPTKQIDMYYAAKKFIAGMFEFYQSGAA